MKVQTNNHRRHFLFRHEVPNDVLESQFSHLDEDESEDGYFQYLNTWYHLSDFVRVSNNPWGNVPELAELGWDGYHSHGYGHAVVIKVYPDGETFKVGGISVCR